MLAPWLCHFGPRGELSVVFIVFPRLSCFLLFFVGFVIFVGFLPGEDAESDPFIDFGQFLNNFLRNIAQSP